MRFADLAAASDAVRAASGRKEKVAHIAEALRALASDEVAAGTAYLSGDLLQRQVGVGWAALRDRPAPAADPALTVAEVDAALDHIGGRSGPGSVAARREALGALLARATEPEQRLLHGLLSGNLRQGALEGVVTDAVAQAAGVPLAAVRRAAFLRGDLPAVAEVALRGGATGLAAIGLEVGRCWPAAPRASTTRWSASGPPRWSGSSMAPASRSTAVATRSACSPARSTT
jgi:ATP-dependent DNA ligase